MRSAWLLTVLLLLISCGPPATLFTDDIFSAAAPEIVQSWSALAPFRDASVRHLPPGAGLSWWNEALKAAPAHFSALVGAATLASERTTLVATHPAVHFVFFLPPAEAAGFATISFDRSSAWLQVTRSAAAVEPGPATAIFPSDATESEIRRVTEAWERGQAGSLTAFIFSKGSWKAPSQGAVFQWAGSETDSWILNLPSDRRVHGNPGQPRAPGATGLTWQLQKSGLGNFLWSAAQDRGNSVHILPLETVSANR